MALIRLLATGGTIASTHDGSGYRASASGADLLATAATPAGARVETVDVTTTGGFALQPGDLCMLLRTVGEALRDGADGIVITHGTDTMEEVSFLAALGHADPRPVVFTGAQRPYDHPAADGPANLTDALAVAASRQARGRGVLLAVDGRVFGARGVTKVDTASLAAFDAPGRGPQLRVAWNEVLALGTPDPVPVVHPDLGSLALPRVDVVAAYVGADGALLRASVAAGARGLVLAAFGAGNATPSILAAVDEVTGSGIPVLVCSRVPAGPVHPLYRGGGGADLADAGAIFGADLSPWQGRMLLAAALAADPRHASTAVRHWLDASAGPDGAEEP